MQSDNLSHTVSYADIYNVLQEEMALPVTSTRAFSGAYNGKATRGVSTTYWCHLLYYQAGTTYSFI